MIEILTLIMWAAEKDMFSFGMYYIALFTNSTLRCMLHGEKLSTWVLHIFFKDWKGILPL